VSATTVAADSEDLEALFDSIIQDNQVRELAVATKKDGAQDDAAGGDVMSRIGHLTRTLHDALRELGYDRLLEKTASEMPNARDRLAYVVTMTEQAATRALNAIDAAQPIQDKLEKDSERLSGEWKKLFDKQMSVDEFKALVDSTRSYLDDVPKQARITNGHLLEIMMAQDFQDLTGQVIKKITELAQSMEQQLVHLLVDMAPAEKRSEIDTGLLNGPVVNAAASGEVVTSQDQVDDLLGSLGF
jgi:chemotaxis protein CheZ